MATRLTYTTGSRSAELDRAFEAALAEAREERQAEPLTHLVGGREVAAGDAFDREDPSRREQVASRAREGAEAVPEAIEAAQAAQREWRRLPHAERVDRRGRGGDRPDRDLLPAGRVGRGIRDAARAAFARRAQHRRPPPVRR